MVEPTLTSNKDCQKLWKSGQYTIQTKALHIPYQEFEENPKDILATKKSPARTFSLNANRKRSAYSLEEKMEMDWPCFTFHCKPYCRVLSL
ncbi:Hypothetical predicted protein [Mytilus galloprovincialis]|uniref:Uncharacterized protein n=1 Tax=Mytilus galloprovincialis TaxID=29158 RepID=A0A8B6HFX9_MYTGA|nr:Hypothetical predicted protein [Mytilus galloprovincialis]